jgi:hypothetical protein
LRGCSRGPEPPIEAAARPRARTLNSRSRPCLWSALALSSRIGGAVAVSPGAASTSRLSRSVDTAPTAPRSRCQPRSAAAGEQGAVVRCRRCRGPAHRWLANLRGVQTNVIPQARPSSTVASLGCCEPLRVDVDRPKTATDVVVRRPMFRRHRGNDRRPTGDREVVAEYDAEAKWRCG